MRTKAEILAARLVEAEATVANLRREIDGLETVTIRADGEPVLCGGCQQPLITEGDFARHFVVPNETYPNLGECPVEQVRMRRHREEAARETV